jgi:Fe-S-cluster-containing dehydrogenase component
MSIDRRSLLKGLAVAGAGAAVGAAPAQAEGERTGPPEGAVGLLYDATRCIGCRACVTACKEANGLPAAVTPEDLSGYTKNIIKQYVGDGERSYIKGQCMHCLEPSCATACMLGALAKREHGIVTWDPSKCIGCRYCQVACPFNIPKFQWDTPVPKIVKCELCNHIISKDGELVEGAEPACCEICPKEAVIFGRYEDLLADAHQRLEANPDLKIYGETDGGGTQVLVLADVDFDKLGLPDLGDEPAPKLAQTVQHGIYKGAIAPVALYAVLGAVIWRNRRSSATEGKEEE